MSAAAKRRSPPRGIAGASCWTLVLTLACVLGAPAAAVGQEAHPRLAAFERMIGGRWYLGEGSYHTFAWGVGKQSVVATSYFVTPNEEKRVSELTYLYHPGEDAVKGYGVAIDMGVDLFEYTVYFQGDTIAFDLKAYGSAIGESPLRETWVFTDEDHYVWTLFEQAAGDWTRSMGGTYERRPER